MRLFYPVANVVMKALLVVLTRWRVEGKENIPRRGPLIVVSNHLSLIDSPLLGASIPLRIRFMAKQELFRPLFVRTVIQAYGAFPVRRGQLDRAVIRWALQALRDGAVLGMFPEGTRSPNGRLQSAQLGTSLIASRSGVRLLPVGISGSEKIKGVWSVLRRPRITVSIGLPFALPSVGEASSRSRLLQQTDLIMERIAELLPQSYLPPDGVRNGPRNSDGG